MQLQDRLGGRKLRTEPGGGGQQSGRNAARDPTSPEAVLYNKYNFPGRGGEDGAGCRDRVRLDAPAAGEDNGRRSCRGIFGTRPRQPARAGW